MCDLNEKTELNCHIRKLKADEIETALALVWKVFLEFEAPDYSESGVDEFYKSIHDKNYLAQLRLYGAFVADELIGVIASRSEGAHIALFFVDEKYQKKGAGRMLFNALLSDCKSEMITVNSSPYAVPIYKKLGFCVTDAEQSVNGLRFTPMEFKTEPANV
ncbi:MAG: GNAT family N-acetyltransferase [Clostridia bacterium]|nr:GNAT family N-acetyltransferase [Clostridia bacterium]